MSNVPAISRQEQATFR